MRLRFFFFLIIIYVIAAFGWLTYSLVTFSHNEYTLKDQILKAGMQACVLRVIEMGKNDEFATANAEVYHLRQIELNVDPDKLNRFLKSYNYGSYQAKFGVQGDLKTIDLVVAAEKTQEIKSELDSKVRLYMFEAVLLTILVGAGIYGVYSSVQMIYNLNKQQNNFLLSVTHELKTPIAAMKLMLQTIRHRNLPDEKRNELMDKAIENSDRLNELTENMLTAMQIENDRYMYARDLFSVSDMMHSAEEHYRNQIPISAEIEENLEMVGDRFILRISLNNLIENAIKYSGNQPIHIRLFAQKDKAVIEVCDEGPGVPESERKKIFKRFYRVEDEEIRDTKGTGLGLFIVKQSVEKHKGNVSVRPNSPKGSIFRIELPLVKNE
ncbi:MAG: GHKL domain-containing protein [Bacteroidetes bacterium]|nr:GHKL domain-containing protein [Bacteroidota bacterium]